MRRTTDRGVVNLLLGNGDGSFRAPAQIHASQYPFCVAVADFNNDQKLDVVIGDQSTESLSVLLGNGDGAFQPANTITLASSGSVQDIMSRVVAESGYRQLLADSEDQQDQERLANIEELITAAHEFDDQNPGNGQLEREITVHDALTYRVSVVRARYEPHHLAVTQDRLFPHHHRVIVDGQAGEFARDALLFRSEQRRTAGEVALVDPDGKPDPGLVGVVFGMDIGAPQSVALLEP